MTKPKLAIVGLGRYYRKLEAGIAEHFTPVLKADVEDVEATGGVKPLVSRAAPDAVMLLTPNHLHCKHLLELAELRLPILVEKPLVTTERDLGLVLQSIETNHSIYCSDFYVDVRATPLLAWLGRPHARYLDKWTKVETESGNLRQLGISALGPIYEVEAVLLEGAGDAASFEGRDWLWDQVHGGVLWDLAYHYIVLWHHLFGTSLSVDSTDARVMRDSPSQRPAESYAALDLHSSSGTRFGIRVGKYYEHGKNERWFRLQGPSGRAEMTFHDPNVLRASAESSTFTSVLTGNYYSHVVGAFREYLDSGASQPYGLDSAVAATRLIATIKDGIRLKRESRSQPC